MTHNNIPHDFDFLVGEWNIINRRRGRNSLVADPQQNQAAVWEEFPAKGRAEKFLDGLALIDHFDCIFPNGQQVKGMTIRSYDPTTGQWSILWLDNRQPPDLRPLVGGFKNGIGEFYQVIETGDGDPLHVRFIWDNITPTTARWQQAFSTDAGATWDTNWVMEFTREGHR
ncbi:MAG: DUF1579 domain-containing protein [Anaerolineae bacterium]|nr:DUF1579 domain-containing protein [Anaerolineae bacterium]